MPEHYAATITLTDSNGATATYELKDALVRFETNVDADEVSLDGVQSWWATRDIWTTISVTSRNVTGRMPAHDVG